MLTPTQRIDLRTRLLAAIVNRQASMPDPRNVLNTIESYAEMFEQRFGELQPPPPVEDRRIDVAPVESMDLSALTVLEEAPPVASEPSDEPPTLRSKHYRARG